MEAPAAAAAAAVGAYAFGIATALAYRSRAAAVLHEGAPETFGIVLGLVTYALGYGMAVAQREPCK